MCLLCTTAGGERKGAGTRQAGETMRSGSVCHSRQTRRLFSKTPRGVCWTPIFVTRELHHGSGQSYRPIRLPTASPRYSPVPQATPRARSAVAPGAGEAGRPRCPGQAVSGARRGTPRGAEGARGHHGQIHRTGHDGAVGRWQALQQRTRWGHRAPVRDHPLGSLADRPSRGPGRHGAAHSGMCPGQRCRVSHRHNLDNEGKGCLRLHHVKARPWPGPRLGPLRQRRDV